MELQKVDLQDEAEFKRNLHQIAQAYELKIKQFGRPWMDKFVAYTDGVGELASSIEKLHVSFGDCDGVDRSRMISDMESIEAVLSQLKKRLRKLLEITTQGG
jgi:hypothetical protein